jgi:hypothetical protein
LKKPGLKGKIEVLKLKSKKNCKNNKKIIIMERQ